MFRTKQIKAEGDSHSSNATVTRLQTQLNGKQNDLDLMLQAKLELEKALKAARQETINAEKSRDDIYKQLVSNKENLDIMTNEQMILSEELTSKQNEVFKAEREKIAMEREILELRPLKESLKTYTESQQKNIEDMTRGEFEKNKLNQKVRELETQLQISTKDTQELSENYQKLVKEKNALMQ